MATWLSVCQGIASDIDSLNFNSIGDSPEAEQIANIVLGVYNDLVTDIDSISAYTFADIIPDPDGKAWKWWLPTAVTELNTIEVDTATSPEVASYIKLKYLHPEEFLRRFSAKHTTGDERYISVPIGNEGTFANYSLNRTAWPTYYTSFDNISIVLDAVKSMQPLSPTKFRLLVNQAHILDVVPNELAPIGLTPEAERYLVSESRSRAFDWIAQAPNAKSEYEARMRKRKLSRANSRTRSKTRFPDYGRGSQRNVNVMRDKYRGY